MPLYTTWKLVVVGATVVRWCIALLEQATLLGPEHTGIYYTFPTVGLVTHVLIVLTLGLLGATVTGTTLTLKQVATVKRWLQFGVGYRNPIVFRRY